MITVIGIEPTPNPNALKFIVNRAFVPGGTSVTYMTAKDAGADPLGAQLLRIPGVTSVFYMNDFITLSKSESADWDDIVNDAESIIGSTPPVLVDLGAPPETPAAPAFADGAEFESLKPPDRLARINRILDEEIRPALAGDGGGLQVLGIDGDTVRVHYQGACGSCPTSSAGTLVYIETRLKELLSGKLVLAAE